MSQIATVKRFIAKYGLDANNVTLINVADPVNPTDASNLESQTAAILVETNRATTAEGLLVPKTTTVNGHALSANVTVTASDIGLGNVTNVAQLANTQALAITGDVTATSTGLNTGSIATTLTTVNSNVGTFGSATNIPVVTVDGKGRVTAASTVAVSIPSGSIAVTGGDVTMSGNTGANITNATLATVTQGTGNSFVKITLDTKGRVTGNTAVAQADITALLGAASITNTMLANNSVTIGSSNVVLGGTLSSVSGLSLVAPVLGTPASGTLTNCTGLPYSGLTGTVPTWNQNTTGTAANVTGTVAIANGGTGAVTAAAALTSLGAYPASNPSNYISSAGAPVQSVAGRTGAVTLAQADIAGLTTVSSPTFSAVTATTFTGNLSGNATTASTATNVAGGAAGELHYQSAPGVTGYSSVGVTGQVVLSGGSGAPTFLNQNALTLQSSQITAALGFTPISTAAQGIANGVATLDSSGKLTVGQIPAALVGAMQYQGIWNASTNTPTLTSGTGIKGQYYKVSVAGTTTIDTISQWNVGDMIVYDGTTWDKIDGLGSEVTSVAGRVGAVVLSQPDITGLTTSSSPTFAAVTAATFTGNLSGNATTATSVAYTGLTGTVPTWNQNTTGTAATATLAATVTTNANLTGDVTSVGNATTVVKLNGTLLAGLATGLLKNTTSTGVPSIAVQADITRLLGAGSITNTMLANSAIANLSGSNTGDQTITLTGAVTGSGVGSFATTLNNASVTGQVLTGYASGVGTISATDTILSAINKLSGNMAVSGSSSVTFNNQVGTTYTTVLSDGSYTGNAGALVTFTNAATQTVTIPPNSTVAYPVGTTLQLVQLGTGKVTIAPDSGVTINSNGGLKSIAAQYVVVTLIKTATNTWLLIGSLIA